MVDRKLFVNEAEIPAVRVQREGSSGYGFARTVFDPETTGTANAVVGTFTIPPDQTESILPHAHAEYDESEYILTGEGYLLMGPSRDEIERYELKPGSAFFVPAGYPHSVTNTGKGDLKILFSFYPGWVSGKTYKEIGTELTDIKKL